jgi:hypothetical protein
MLGCHRPRVSGFRRLPSVARIFRAGFSGPWGFAPSNAKRLPDSQVIPPIYLFLGRLDTRLISVPCWRLGWSIPGGGLGEKSNWQSNGKAAAGAVLKGGSTVKLNANARMAIKIDGRSTPCVWGPRDC